MEIDSTINVHLTNLDTLINTSNKTGYEINDIVILLLRKVMLDYKHMRRKNIPIEYQERDPQKRWSKFHIRYENDLYEFCQDMRKFYKMSISKILDYSIKKYLKIIIHELSGDNENEERDNYLFSGYIFKNFEQSGAVFWLHTWGIPDKKT